MSGDELIIYLALCGIPFLINILLIFDSRSSLIGSMIEVKKVRKLMILGVILSALYFIDHALYRHSYLEERSLGMLVNSLIFISNMLYVLAYADQLYTKHGESLKKRRIPRFLFLAPILVLLALDIANIFYPIFFNILPDTFEYKEGPLIAAAIGVPTLYIVFAAIHDIAAVADNSARYYNMPVSVYFLITLSGIFLEDIFYDIPLIPTFGTVSMMILYMRMLKLLGYIDSLSGLYTRSHLTPFINDISSKLAPQEMLAGIMLDVDHFKYINDTYGHVVGDRAIMAIGRILRETTKKKGTCFRYGGDEFIIIMKASDKKQVEELMQRIDDATKEFNEANTELFTLSVSRGYAIYDTSNESIIRFVDKMDAEMYKNKHSA